MSKKTIGGQKDRRSKKIQGNTSESGIKCVCLNARSIINKYTELNIMVDDIKPHIIGITESWANNDISDIIHICCQLFSNYLRECVVFLSMLVLMPLLSVEVLL